VSNCLAADNFVVPAGKTLTINTIQLWGFYEGDASAYMDNFTIVFYADWDGLLGDTFPAILPATTTREATGAFLFGSVPEYLITLTLSEPKILTTGTYWISIYNNGGDQAANGIFTWELTSNADSGGLSRSTIAEFDSVNGWQANTGYSYLALRLIGSLVTPPVTHTISGYLFHDANGNGIFDPEGMDPDQYNSSGMVELDQHCDGQDFDDYDAWVYTGEDGSFTFSGLPEGETFCAAPHLSLGYEMTTAPVRFDALAADQTGLMIGMRHMQFVLDRPIPDYEMGVPLVNQSFTITGGQAPYTIQPGEIGLPPGMTWSFDDNNILTLSGTPGLIGDFFFSAWFTDANGVEDELQTFILVRTDADMMLESSANPSAPGQEVTFTFTANRPDLTWSEYLSPTGTVTFSADGAAIAESCTNIPIYFEWIETDPVTGDGYDVYRNTATCTATLPDGSHEISAVFDNHEADGTFDYTSPYHDATVTLTQTVQLAIAAPVVTYTQLLPEPSLAGYPMTRPYIYFTGQAGYGNYSCTVDYGDGTVLTGRVEDRGGTVPTYICDGYIDVYHEFYTYANPGDYTLKFTIHDTYGNETIHEATHTVVADQDPGYITWTPSPAVVNQPVTFTTTQTADFYGWILVSGPEIPMPMAFGTEPTATFQPTSTGTYKVELYLGYLSAGTMTMVADGAEVVVAEPIQADLSVTKTDSKDPVKPGAQLVYTLTVSNLGPNTAESVVLSDKLDPNTTYVSTSVPKGWKCSYAKNSATATCTTSSLASGSSATIKITVTVNKTARVGKELVNNATVSSMIYDPIMTNNTVVQKTMVAK
jgi:uncharacterized repeat protein (TIGR01451 family)